MHDKKQNNDEKIVNAALVLEMKKNGLEPKQLAARTGITQRNIQRIINNPDKDLLVGTAKKICHTLGVNIEMVF